MQDCDKAEFILFSMFIISTKSAEEVIGFLESSYKQVPTETLPHVVCLHLPYQITVVLRTAGIAKSRIQGPNQYEANQGTCLSHFFVVL